MTSSSTQSAGPSRAAFSFIFVALVLDMVALGIVVPVLPKLVVDFSHGDTAEGARMYGVFGSVWAIMQFFFAPVLGALSDRFGRRPVILISCFGLGLDYLLMAVAPSLAWLLVGRAISGITAASYPTATAYVADVTPPDKRAASFGMLGAAFGLGFVLGPAIGGVLGVINPRLPFWVAAILCLVNAVYGVFVLPESLPADKRAPFRLRTAHPLASLRLLQRHAGLPGLAASSFLGYVAHEALPSTFVLYAHHRYQWSERDVGLTLALVGVCSSVVQAGLVGRIVGKLGEARTLLLGVACGAIGFAVQGLSPTGALFLIGVPFISLWGLSNPATQGLMTRRVGADEQGQLQGAVSSLRGIAGLFSPTLFTFTFAHFIAPEHTLLGAPFLLAALLVVLSLVLALRTIGSGAHG